MSSSECSGTPVYVYSSISWVKKLYPLLDQLILPFNKLLMMLRQPGDVHIIDLFSLNQSNNFALVMDIILAVV